MLSDLFIRLRSLFRRRAVEDELDEELRFHLEHQVEKYIQAGPTREEAMRRSRSASRLLICHYFISVPFGDWS